MYAPRLRVDFEFAGEPETEVNDRLVRRLQSGVASGLASNRIAVSVAGGAAIVRGAVASERDRKLAELMLHFEPGIASSAEPVAVRPAGVAKPHLPLPASRSERS